MALSTTAATRPHRPWVKWVRLAVSAVLLAVLITKFDADDLLPDDRSLPGALAFLCSGIAIMGLSFLLASWRWQRVLAVYGAQVPLRTLLKHYLAGQFVGNALPSTIGGDVLRVSRCARDVGPTEVAFASVVIERLTGFFALPVLTFVGFLIEPSLLEKGRSWIAVVIAGSTLAILGVILLLAGSPKLAGRFKDHENWMRYIGIVHVGVDRLRRDPRDAWGALGAAVAYQLSVVIAVYCAVHTIGLTISNASILAFVPAVAMVQVLPISLSGLGVREGTLALLWHPLSGGVPTAQSVAVGLLWYAMTVIVSLAAAPAFVFGHHDRDHKVTAPVAGSS
ncbi:MAG: flippase-like domain-containing protein [Actinobacteria bacterium]|nr:flippase-like domain-containing protein [Actinomycetota bacterium]